MGGNERVLYPMLGVGAFFAAFWVGVVIGYELGFSCFGLLLHGLGFALLGALLVAKLERDDGATPGTRVSESMASRSRPRSVEPSMTPPEAGAEYAKSRAGRPGAAKVATARGAFARPA